MMERGSVKFLSLVPRLNYYSEFSILFCFLVTIISVTFNPVRKGFWKEGPITQNWKDLDGIPDIGNNSNFICIICNKIDIPLCKSFSRP